MNENFYAKSYEQLESHIQALGFNPLLTKTVFDKYYKFKNPKSESTPKHFFEVLEDSLDFSLPKISNIQKADDGTIKFLIEFNDSLKVETVLIPFFKKYTICLSSQVGCAMNCSFCFTGTQGLKRNLQAHEIVMQYMIAYHYLKDHISSEAPTPNIVFMGQGEPLHNFEAVKKAIRLFTDKKALHLGPRQITVSTAGYLPGLKRFNELSQVNLAVSFHSADNLKRNELIPLNQKYPIDILTEELKNISRLKRQYITFEYLLIDEFNASKDDAELLINIIKDSPIIVNIIPFNPFPGSKYLRPGPTTIETFKEYLVAGKIRTMVRTTKGDDILAACGQLNTL
jgi:23S rRNA (adenine2503-C2)-methyltransferase